MIGIHKAAANALHPPLEGEGIGGLRPPFFRVRTPMQSIGYGSIEPLARSRASSTRYGEMQAGVGVNRNAQHSSPHPAASLTLGVDPPPPGEGEKLATPIWWLNMNQKSDVSARGRKNGARSDAQLHRHFHRRPQAAERAVTQRNISAMRACDVARDGKAEAGAAFVLIAGVVEP